ncbi:MAG: conserved rane protein of unknown function [Blastococcus sp.]|jgi:hypothetical protein|nr:conserved rane protein of unknown function [Blastococcus sp.]
MTTGETAGNGAAAALPLTTEIGVPAPAQAGSTAAPRPPAPVGRPPAPVGRSPATKHPRSRRTSRMRHQTMGVEAGGTPPPAQPPRSATGAHDAAERVRLWGAPAMSSRPRRMWREQVLARADELAALTIWLDSRTDGPSTSAAGWAADAVTDRAIQGRLTRAVDAAQGLSFWPGPRSARMERAFCNIDGAQAEVLRRTPGDYLSGLLPDLLAHVRAHLPPTHPERMAVEDLAAEDLTATSVPAPLTDAQRATVVSAVGTASAAARREHSRLRSFRNIVIMTTVAMLVLAGGLAVMGARQPAWIPLCFAPQGLESVVCPTATAALPDDPATGVPASGADTASAIAATAQPHDIALVMLVGLAAAAVTGAAALRHVRGTSTPFAVPVALVALKLPTGALTALFGLLLIQGGFVPGLSALDSSGQILAWALLFGAAQQLVTGLVDKKAQSVLDSVGSAPMIEDKE